MASTGPLADWQDGFAHALMNPDAVPANAPIRDLAAQPGFAVYRNTVMKGAIDALHANYPAVARLVGEEWFRAAACVYVRARPPRSPVLLEYGDAFAAFLAGFEPAREIAYLADVARIERFWTEAHLAADEVPVAADAVARLDRKELETIVLRPHASARWAWFDAAPAVTIWQRNRATEVPAGDALDWCSEGILISRPGHAVEHHALDRAGCLLLERCAQGATLLDAALHALADAPDADLERLIGVLLRAGAFGQMRSIDPPGEGDNA